MYGKEGFFLKRRGGEGRRGKKKGAHGSVGKRVFLFFRESGEWGRD